VFETAGGKRVGSNETPAAEFNVPASNTTIRHHPLEGVEVEHEGQVRSASQAADEARERVHEARDRSQNTELSGVNGNVGYVSVSGLSLHIT